MQGFRRFIAATASVVVGAASFALSFVALRDVSVQLEAVPPSLGWLVPIVIDGGVICGSAVIWSLSHEQRRRPVFPFLFVGSLVIVSVVVNAAHAGPTILAKLIASLPPLILLGTLELVAAQGRRQAENVSESATANAPFQQEPYAGIQTASTSFKPSPTTQYSRPAFEGLSDPTMISDGNPTVVPSPAVAQHSPTQSIMNTHEESEVKGSVVDVPVSTGFDTALETAVEEAFAPASEWVRPDQGTYNRETGSSAQARRRTARVRAEEPTF
jgi:hypothetical protein